jgi:hypothetical protein
VPHADRRRTRAGNFALAPRVFRVVPRPELTPPAYLLSLVSFLTPLLIFSLATPWPRRPPRRSPQQRRPRARPAAARASRRTRTSRASGSRRTGMPRRTRAGSSGKTTRGRCVFLFPVVATRLYSRPHSSITLIPGTYTSIIRILSRYRPVASSSPSSSPASSPGARSCSRAPPARARPRSRSRSRRSSGRACRSARWSARRCTARR